MESLSALFCFPIFGSDSFVLAQMLAPTIQSQKFPSIVPSQQSRAVEFLQFHVHPKLGWQRLGIKLQR